VLLEAQVLKEEQNGLKGSAIAIYIKKHRKQAKIDILGAVARTYWSRRSFVDV